MWNKAVEVGEPSTPWFPLSLNERGTIQACIGFFASLLLVWLLALCGKCSPYHLAKCFPQPRGCLHPPGY